MKRKKTKKQIDNDIRDAAIFSAAVLCTLYYAAYVNNVAIMIVTIISAIAILYTSYLRSEDHKRVDKYREKISEIMDLFVK